MKLIAISALAWTLCACTEQSIYSERHVPGYRPPGEAQASSGWSRVRNSWRVERSAQPEVAEGR